MRCLNIQFLTTAVSVPLLQFAQHGTVVLSWSRDPGHAHFSEIFDRVMSELSLGTCLPNLKFVSSAILELLAFNAQKFTGSRDRGHAYLLETFVRSHVGTIPENMPAKFEVRIFSRF